MMGKLFWIKSGQWTKPDYLKKWGQSALQLKAVLAILAEMFAEQALLKKLDISSGNLWTNCVVFADYGFRDKDGVPGGLSYVSAMFNLLSPSGSIEITVRPCNNLCSMIQRNRLVLPAPG